MRMPKSHYDILLIEDDLGDAGLVRIALRRGPFTVQLHHVKDSVEAMAFLRRIGPAFQDAPRPDLILLDLNLPGRSGHEILEEIKADGDLNAVPVVVLSTSEAERDVLKAYALGANTFVTKPMDADEFSRAIHAIETFWFTVAQLPVGS
jgi:CheY-like chemotaxis protein